VVAHRIDRAHHVHDVGVFEAANHVHDRVHFADVRQELVAQTLALGRALHQPRDIHELDHGRDLLLGPDELEQAVEPGVGHGDHADVGLDGAERVVLCRRLRGGEGVEQGGLADVG